MQLLLVPPTMLFSFAGRRFLPALALFAILAPGFRARKAASLPLDVVQPDTARLLRSMQRDQAARFVLGVANEAAFAVEHSDEGHLLIHYAAKADPANARRLLTIAGGWLGAGRRRYMWLPLRPSLVWNAPVGPEVLPAEIAVIAANLHAGLDLMGERHVLEEFLEPAPIPMEERRQVLDNYTEFMRSHGWQVTYDEQLSRRSLKRTETAENPQTWSIADREALTRLEALVSEMLKGVRSSSRILYQTK